MSVNLNASLFCLLQYTPVSLRVSAMYYYMPLLGIPVLVFVVVVFVCFWPLVQPLVVCLLFCSLVCVFIFYCANSFQRVSFYPLIVKARSALGLIHPNEWVTLVHQDLVLSLCWRPFIISLTYACFPVFSVRVGQFSPFKRASGRCRLFGSM